MKTRPFVTLLPVPLLALLFACDDDTGTPCRQDHHCYSNSCTFGTCDSRWGSELADEVFGEDDSAEEPEGPAVECWGLAPSECSAAPRCKLTEVCGGRHPCTNLWRAGVRCSVTPAPQSSAACIQSSACTPR